MKVCWVVEVECNLLWTLSGCELSASCPDRFTAREMSRGVHRPEAGWVTEPVWTFWRNESSLALAGNGTLDCPACSLVSRLTTLQWPTRLNKISN
jgi:hypothetical protein